MDFSFLGMFFMKNLFFSLSILLVSFIPGWLLYNHIVLKKICLKDALFEKDNLAAWIEFIGAFIFPALYLAAKAIEGSLSENMFYDLLICAAYALVYIILLTVLRLLSGGIINSIASGDHEGKINLNNEIYGQKNIAASLFSISLSVIFVSMIRFLDIVPEYIVTSLLKVSTVLIFSLIAFVAYSIMLRKKSTLFNEIFVDNNVAASTAFLGFIFAVETILTGAVTLQAAFNFTELVAFCLISLLVFGLLSLILKWLFTAMVKVDIWKEIYDQNNIGAAIGQSALYIGIANVILHFLK